MTENLYRLSAVNKFKEPHAAVTNDLKEVIAIATQLCGTSSAAVTFIDENSQMVRTLKDNEILSTDCGTSFCSHTIQQRDIILINDTHLDDRFINSPSVTGSPFIRFYAGVPLITKDGYVIGSFSVLDIKPTELTANQKNSLLILAKQIMNVLELNWTLSNLEEQHEHTQKQKAIIDDSELKLQAVFNSSKHTHILVNRKLEVVAFNKASAIFVQIAYGKSLKTNTSVLDYADPQAVDAFAAHFNNAFNGNPIRLEWHMRPGTEYDSWKELEFVPIRDEDEKIIGVALNSTDITDQKLQQEHIKIQNDALMRIATMQSHEIRRPVASLLGIMQLMKLETGQGKLEYIDMLEVTVQELDQKIREIVKDSENTLNSHMSIVA